MKDDAEKENDKCAICNEIASGVHYGVLACEGCKGFFRRIITTNAGEKASLICTGPQKNKCSIACRVKSMCQRCRLQKCFNVGMTRKHSKLGRRRKLNREFIQQIRQVKYELEVLTDCELSKRIKSENNFFLRETGQMLSDDSDDVKTEISMTDIKIKEEEIDNRCSVIAKSSQNCFQQFKFDFDRLPSFNTHMDGSYLYSPSLSNFWNNSKFPSTFMNADSEKGKELTEKFCPLVVPIVKINNGEIDQLFIQMNNFLHMKNRDDPDYLTFLKLRKGVYQAHMESCIVTIPIMENFFNFRYHEVPTDTDPDSVWKVMLDEMSPITHRVISFCNNLPDFKTILPFPDTVNVIKLALFDIISLRYLRIVDLDRSQFFDPGLTRKIPAEVMAQNPLGPMFLRYFYVSEFIKRELVDPVDDYEMAYLSALFLTLPGWDSSQTKFIDFSHLNRLKFFYCLCLYDHILVKKYKGNTYETRRRMRRLYTLLDKIKIVTKTQADMLLTFNERNSVIQQFPLILRQIYFDEFEGANENQFNEESM